MATGNSKRSGLGRGLGALITRTDEGQSESAATTQRQDGETSLPSDAGHGQSGINVGYGESGSVVGTSNNDVQETDNSPKNGLGGVLRVPVSAIAPNPHQPRSHFDLDALEELAASVREHGIIQPLIVTAAKEQPVGPGRAVYWLIAGERRWRAAQLAELSTAPVIVREASARQLMELALIENIQREDLNPLEEAAAYQALMDEYSLTQAEVAERVGKSRSAVANAVRLLHLSTEVQEALLARTISSGHARALLGLIDDDKMALALQEVVSRQLNVRQTEALVKHLLEAEEAAYGSPDIAPHEDPMSSHWRGLEDRFRSALGTKVTLNRNDNGEGRLVVHFYNDDDLDSLLRHIAGDDEVL